MAATANSTGLQGEPSPRAELPPMGRVPAPALLPAACTSEQGACLGVTVKGEIGPPPRFPSASGTQEMSANTDRPIFWGFLAVNKRNQLRLPYTEMEFCEDIGDFTQSMLRKQNKRKAKYSQDYVTGTVCSGWLSFDPL